jgi:GWxTD domain-containing protein
MKMKIDVPIKVKNMRTRAKVFSVIPLVLLGLTVILSGAPVDKPKLPERYQRWLDEEVVYIMARTEREVFRQLRTDRERDLFMEAFWKHRDPTPTSPENEFKTEHLRRVAYANQHLGREGSVPGWKTDRGRMYILLGEPQEIQKYAGKLGIYDCESWFYQGKTDLGLPPSFNLLFFKEHGQGMMKLYSPIGNGPQALLSSAMDSPGDFRRAYNTLYDIDATLAGIAMDLLSGDSAEGLGRPTMASDMLIQKIVTLPSRTVSDGYARKFLEYKDIVDVEYSANFIDSASLIKVFREGTGQYFVHYAVEPERLSVNQFERKTYTTLKVNGRVSTLDGRLVYQYDKTVSVEMPEAQVAELSRAPFNLHDVFPLVAGDYRLSVLVKNEVSREFMTVEQALRVPQSGKAVQLTQPLLGYKISRLDAAKRKVRPFQVGPFQVFCQPGRIFTVQDTLAIVFQLNDLPEDTVRTGRVRLTFLKDGQPFREVIRTPSEYADLPNALETIPLADFPPAHYQVQVSLLDGDTEVVKANEEFDLTFAPTLGRPWYSSRVLPEPDDPVYAQIAGVQLLNLGRYPEARASLEGVLLKKPDSPEAAFTLARVYLALSEPRSAVRVLAPLLARPGRVPYEVYTLSGEAFMKSGDFAEALNVLDQAVSQYGVNASVLNAIGRSYLGLSKFEEALASFEKSLLLSPDQPEIRKQIDQLKKRK